MENIKYIINNDRDHQWGLSISTVGFEDISPYTSYPRIGHPSNYYFSPEKGRTLNEYQLIYISEGKGYLTTRSGGEYRLESGNMFLLCPNEWHTYRPDDKSGWKEYWIGFNGAIMDLRMGSSLINKENPVFWVGCNEEIVRLYRQAIFIAQREEVFFQQLLAGITDYLLGLMFSLHKNQQVSLNNETVDAINSARAYMWENVEKEINLQEIASRANMSYSHFRRLFKDYTGVSPAQYFLDIKLKRAKELLMTSSISIKEIAYLLHFETPGYFSSKFKQKTGKKPSFYRDEFKR